MLDFDYNLYFEGVYFFGGGGHSEVDFRCHHPAAKTELQMAAHSPSGCFGRQRNSRFYLPQLCAK